MSTPRHPSLPRAGLLGLAIFSLLLLAPALAAPWFLSEARADLLSALGLSVVLWLFWLALWRTPYFACLAATPFLVLTPIALYVLVTYRTGLNPVIAAVLLETNVPEAIQYLRGQWLRIAVLVALLVTLAAVALTLLHRHEVRWQRRYRLYALLAAPVIFGIFHLLNQPLENAASGLQPVDNPFRARQWPQAIESARLTAPFGAVLQIIDAVDAERHVAAMSRVLEAFRFGATQPANTHVRQVYVLVIGESSRADRWSLNGYARETTPLLAKEPNLVNFGDVVTPVAATRASVPLILTRKPAALALSPSFTERSLVSAFREAGFSTYWLSNQSPFGTFDSPYAIYAKEAEHVLYFNMTGDWRETPTDGVMLDSLRRVLAEPGETRQFIVLHTLGSHLEYRRRYPEAFEHFRPTLDAVDPIGHHDADYRKRLDNTYDNSILYTDFFLSETLAALKASGRPLATLLYVSDHGEDLYDGGCDHWAHGARTLAGLRVPLFVWYSAQFERTFPGKVAALAGHRTLPLTTAAVFPTLIDAAGIELAGPSPAENLLSPTLTPPAKRLVFSLAGGSVDFDRAHLNPQCELVE